jgi:hypothetical protein
VVTPMSAIGRTAPAGAPVDRTLNARLASYAGTSRLLGAEPRFQALEDWHAVGLRLFVPQDFAFRLYPRLHPSPAGADKLVNALMGRPVGRHERSDLILLLVDGGSSSLSACSLHTAEFRPLARAIDWHCAVNVDPLPVETVTELQAYAKQSFMNALVGSVGSDFTAEEQAALTAMAARLQADMEADARAAAQHQVAALDLRKALESLRGRWSNMRLRLAGVVREAERFDGAATLAAQSVPALQAAIQSIAEAASALDKERLALKQDSDRLRAEQNQDGSGPWLPR